MMATRVLYSGFRFSHHNPGAGYDTCVPAGRAYVCGNTLPCSGFPEPSLPRRLNFLLVDLLTLARGLRYDAVHYLNPENTAYLSPLVLRLLGKRIIYTLHLRDDTWLAPVRSPYWRLKHLSLRSANVIVALSRAQRETYARRFPRKVVEFIPHGRDFGQRHDLPEELVARRLSQAKVLVVGQNYRDFDLLSRIIETRGDRHATFHLVGMSPAIKQRFAGRAGVICHPRLDANAYEELLAGALVMLLPLSFATANNALLEAYTAYLPVLANRIPGVTDYTVDGDESLFDTPDEFWAKYDALAGLSLSRFRERCLGLEQRARARFAWPAVRRLLEPLY